MTDECEYIVNFLNCDYELFISEKNIVGRFNKLTKQGKKDGFIPLIVLPSDILAESLGYIFEDGSIEDTPDGIAAYRQTAIDAANEIDARGFLSSRFKESMEMFKDGSFDIYGEFAQVKPQKSLPWQMLTYKSSGEVIIAKIPTENPWELAAWIPMGGFNACPAPAEQVAVFRYWHEKYGAVPAVVSYDTWDMTLERPPSTAEDAEVLAEEHFAFCEDSVVQGAETIRKLASMLKKSIVWDFWWD